MKRHASVRRQLAPTMRGEREGRIIPEAFDDVALTDAVSASRSASKAPNVPAISLREAPIVVGEGPPTQTSQSRSQERLVSALPPIGASSMLSTISLPTEDARDRFEGLALDARQSDTDSLSTEADDVGAVDAASASGKVEKVRDSFEGPTLPPPNTGAHRTKAQRRAVVREMVADLKPVLDERVESLPISAQKSAVLSCTRPTHLPPKSRKEEKKHLTQYEQLLRKSLKHEDTDHRRQARLVARKARHLAASADEWEKHILPNFQSAIKQSRTRAMWWAGLPLRVRGRVWVKCIANTLQVSSDTFATALRNAKTAEADLVGRSDRGERDDQELLTLSSFSAVRESVLGAFPSLRLFQVGGPLHGALTDVLLAYRFYRADIEYHSGIACVAALLLLNLPPPAAFVALVNLMNRTILLALHTRDKITVERKLAGFPELLAKVRCCTLMWRQLWADTI